MYISTFWIISNFLALLESNTSMRKLTGIQFSKRNDEEEIHPFPDAPFWDCPKFKETADDNWNVAIKGF